MTDTVTVVTWNIQGLAGVDAPAIAGHLRSFGADVVLLQEVQRRQLASIARAGDYEHRTWAFKHWPIKRPSEGHGVLADERIRDRDVHTLSRREWLWSWRRRIAVCATIGMRSDALAVVVTHLGAGVPESERVRQARKLISLAGDAGVIAGDLNTLPRSSTLEAFAEAGWIDAWNRQFPTAEEPHTNWNGGRRHPPNQRLDYVLVRPGFAILDVSVPDNWRDFARLSDHLPVVVRFRRA